MTQVFSPIVYFDLTQSASEELFSDIEQVWEVLGRLDEYLAHQFEQGVLKPNYQNSTNVYVGEGTVIAASATIEGPAIIGPNCTIGNGAYIRGGCWLGERVHVGHAVELKHTIVLDGAAIAHLNYLGDTVVGERANISGGAICANVRLDKKPVTVRDSQGARVDTGLEKLGAIIGDDCQVGVNAVLNPGTMLGKGCVVYPVQSVTGTYEAGSVIR